MGAALQSRQAGMENVWCKASFLLKAFLLRPHSVPLENHAQGSSFSIPQALEQSEHWKMRKESTFSSKGDPGGLHSLIIQILAHRCRYALPCSPHHTAAQSRYIFHILPFGTCRVPRLLPLWPRMAGPTVLGLLPSFLRGLALFWPPKLCIFVFNTWEIYENSKRKCLNCPI